MTTLAISLACHNRREKTVACLQALDGLMASHDPRIHVFLCDDGSTDGTAAAVRARFPEVRILSGDGTLFWNGGMRVAFGAALAAGYDFYLWLNDDTVLDTDALARLLAAHREMAASGPGEGIVVGSTRDREGRTSYGGLVRTSRWRPIRFRRVVPGDRLLPCDTMNGNCVLIPAAVARRLGNLDAGFVHSMGDNDYGLRASRLGIPIRVMPGYAGTCVNDATVRGSFKDSSLPLAVRWKKLVSPKALPPGAWLVFCRRHGGPGWPLAWLWPYARVVLAGLTFRQGGRKTAQEVPK